MGLLSSIGSFFGGPLGGLLGGAGDYLLGKSDAEDAQNDQINSARAMRGTAYQDTVRDLQAAGLNPMLAFSNGPTSTTYPTLNNKGLASAQQNQAMSTSALQSTQMDNIKADTENKRAQADQIVAQTALLRAQEGQTTTSTANVAQQTENLKQQIPQIQAEISRIIMDKDLKYQQGLSEVTRRNLMSAQEALSNIDQRLRASQITNTEAMTETQKVLTQLRQLEVPGAKNLADFEKMMDTGAGNAPKAIGGIANSASAIIQLLRSLQK